MNCAMVRCACYIYTFQHRAKSKLATHGHNFLMPLFPVKSGGSASRGRICAANYGILVGLT